MARLEFTKGDEISKIISFGIPIMIGNFLMQLYNYIDLIIVGQVIGKEALAGVGAAAPFIFMLISLVIGISMGSTIIISQLYGKRDIRGVRMASDSLFIFLSFTSIILSSIGIAFSKKMLEAISLPPEVIPYAKSYIDIYLLGLIFLFAFNSLSAILRGVGDSRTPLVFLAISAAINIALDLVFVILLDLGIEGAAWASVISQALAFIFAFVYTNKYNKIIKINLFKLRYSKSIFLKSITLGLPAGAQQLFLSMGMVAILTVVNKFGTDVIAAYAAATRIEAFIFVVPMTMSIALTSFVGQNYGAGKFDRIDKAIKGVIRITMVMSFTIMILLSALGRPLMQMFTSQENIILIGCNYLFILALSYPIFSIMFSIMGSIRGMGNTIIPMIITILTLWVIRIPVADILSERISELGIWISAPISWTIALVAISITYIQLRKKRKNTTMSSIVMENPLDVKEY